MSNLNKAFAISLLYKYGMFSKRADEDQINIRQHAAGGAGLGSLIGFGAGAAKNLKGQANTPAQIALEGNKAPTPPPTDLLGTVSELKGDVKEQLGALNSFEKANPAGSMGRLKQVIKKYGVKRVAGSAMKTGLIVGGIGAVAGAGLGAGVGYARRKMNQGKKKK